MSRGREREDYGPASAGVKNKVSVLVRNIPLNYTAEDLRAKFEKYGDLRDVYIPRDYYTQRSRGFGFIEFRDARDADEAIYHMDRTTLEGREINVCLSKEGRKTPREMMIIENKQGGSGGGGGGGRSGGDDRRDRRRSRSRSPRRDRRHSRSRSPRRGSRYSRSRSPRGRDYDRRDRGRDYDRDRDYDRGGRDRDYDRDGGRGRDYDRDGDRDRDYGRDERGRDTERDERDRDYERGGEREYQRGGSRSRSPRRVAEASPRGEREEEAPRADLPSTGEAEADFKADEPVPGNDSANPNDYY